MAKKTMGDARLAVKAIFDGDIKVTLRAIEQYRRWDEAGCVGEEPILRQMAAIVGVDESELLAAMIADRATFAESA